MQTWRVLLKLRRNGFQFNVARQTERNYVLERDDLRVNVPRFSTLDKWTAAEIFRKAGLLLATIILAGMSSVLRPEESVALRDFPSSTRHLQR